MYKKAILFVITTLFVSYGFAAAYYFIGMPITYKGPFMLIYMMIPGIAAFCIQKIIYRQNIISEYKLSLKANYWWLIAWFTPVVMVFLCVVISLAFPWVYFSMNNEDIIANIVKKLPSDTVDLVTRQLKGFPLPIYWVTLIAGLFAGITVNALSAFGEELGWRGLLLKELAPARNFTASLIIGFVWGVWHAPVVLMGHNYPEHPAIGVFAMILFCMLISPVFTYFTLRSGSIFAACIFHGTINGVAPLASLPFSGGNDLTIGLTALPGIGAILAVIAVILDYERLATNEKDRIYGG